METLHPDQEKIIKKPNEQSNPIFTAEFKPGVIEVTSNKKSEVESNCMREIDENSINSKENSRAIFTYQKGTLHYLTPEEKNTLENSSTDIQKAINALSTFHCYLN